MYVFNQLDAGATPATSTTLSVVKATLSVAPEHVVKATLIKLSIIFKTLSVLASDHKKNKLDA